MVVFSNNSQYDNNNRVNAIIIKRNGCKTVQIAIKARILCHNGRVDAFVAV